VSTAAERAVAVFGSSEPMPGEPAYEDAREVGRLLGRAGLAVVTGGYGGVMEGASRGAREEGGTTIGVTVSSLFGHREPNPYLVRVEDRPDLLGRTRSLIDLAEGFIILPGRAGTLAELSLLWALQRAGIHDYPRVLVGSAWGEVLGLLVRLELLEPGLRETTFQAAGPEEAVALLLRALGGRAGETR
jgi:uncharacterized protein (TIGR00730 family)